MTDVGVPNNFVDTQDVSLTNITDTKTYQQLTNVIFSIDSMVEKNQLTDDTVDNVFSLYMNFIEGDMVVTTDQWKGLFDLTVDTNGVRAERKWEIKWTNAENEDKTTTFDNAQLKTLTPIDIGLGSVMLHFRIEATEDVTVST